VTIGSCLLSVDNSLSDLFLDYPCAQTTDHYGESSLGMNLRLNQPISVSMGSAHESALSLPLDYLVANFGATPVMVNSPWMAARATFGLSANE